MKNQTVDSEYLEWLYEIVCGKRFVKGVSYHKLFICLIEIPFVWAKSIRRDRNRAEDGISLRHRFDLESNGRTNLEDASDPCSVLEMLIALAIRCEEDIMDNPSIGNRTGQWFWKMIVNLGLSTMSDDKFDEELVRNSVNRFMYREYDADGRGGLFWIRGCKQDMRKVEIWVQMLWWLNTIT